MAKGAVNGRAKTLIALHLLLLFYSLSGILSKNAAHEPFLSPLFIVLYGGMLLILFVYAIGWQQILKRLSLSMAFANKAVTVVWGMVWGALIFGESISVVNLMGAAMVIAGVVLYARADNNEAKPGDPTDGDQWLVEKDDAVPGGDGAC
ncbi:EamA family transporter [uncultured Adlercreutzia sp.]|uniref:EamA family transporter n=1 Tax=uncultured Adlercreutzia sp. TaxID=875803 RepID=UPI0026F3C6A5|nr:EamA family transporter [uncultured Adlercreutzia sp.]